MREDSPAVRGKCHEVTKGDGRVRGPEPPNAGTCEVQIKNGEAKCFEFAQAQVDCIRFPEDICEFFMNIKDYRTESSKRSTKKLEFL